MDLRGGREMTDDPTAEASALLSGSPQDAAEGLRKLRKAASGPWTPMKRRLRGGSVSEPIGVMLHAWLVWVPCSGRREMQKVP